MGGSSGGGGGGGGGVPWANIGATIGDIAGYHIGRHQNALASRDSQEWQENANRLYTDLYNETEGDYQPYMEGGTNAYDALLRTYGVGQGQNGQADYSGFENSPDYLWAQESGVNALDRSAASRGRLRSGAQDQALTRFGQGNATQYLGNYREGLGNISNMGLSATNALSQYRQGYGNQLGTGYTNIGDIRAAEHLGQSALHARFNASQKDVWGVGGGGGGGGQSSFSPSFGNGGSGQNGMYPTTSGGAFGSSFNGQQPTYNWGG